MEVREQLIHLVRLQDVIHEARSARALVEGAPVRIEEIESRFRERNAEYVAVRERHEALEADQRVRSGELQGLEETKKKYMDDLMQVKNQREYAAMLKEIDTVKSRIAEHEEAILKDLEEIESVKQELARHHEHITAERQRVEQEHATVEAAAEAARRRIGELVAERKRIEVELPVSLVSAVARLEESRQGQFLALADGGVCQSCFVRVRPQGFQEIRTAAKIHYCSNCRRLLYYKPSLLAPVAKGSEAPASTDAVKAVDGGAI